MAPSKVQVGLRLTEETYAKVKVVARAEKRAMNNLIEYAVERYIKEYEAKNGPIAFPEEE